MFFKWLKITAFAAVSKPKLNIPENQPNLF